MIGYGSISPELTADVSAGRSRAVNPDDFFIESPYRDLLASAPPILERKPTHALRAVDPCRSSIGGCRQ